MRIIYDDAQQQDFVEEIHYIMAYLPIDIKSLIRFDGGTNRVQWKLVKDYLNRELRFNTEPQFEIADKNFDTSGIGNNHLFPVLYKSSPEEIQQCAYISITAGMYGEVYVKVKDYNARGVGLGYKITERGIFNF